jgi:Ca-activated chloride channel family protein
LRCPLTLDYRVLETLLDGAQLAAAEDDGTAIGLALASATNHLRASPARSRVIVLLTDGENNRTTIEPITGAQLAAALGIRVYTVGVGRGTAAQPAGRDRTGEPMMGEASLREIAAETGGRYFRATDGRALAAVLGEMDRLERTPLEAAREARYREWSSRFSLAGLGLLLAELILAQTWLRRLGHVA